MKKYRKTNLKFKKKTKRNLNKLIHKLMIK